MTKKSKKNEIKAEEFVEDEITFEDEVEEDSEEYAIEEFDIDISKTEEDELTLKFPDEVEEEEEVVKEEVVIDLDEEDDEPFDEELPEVEVEKPKKKSKPVKVKAPKLEKEKEEDYEDATRTFNKEKFDKFMKIFNVIFVIIMIAMIFTCVDIILLTKYEKGPIFTIRTEIYKDGGTKEYYGLGYKVIKYNCLEGRRGIDIGTWGLKYDNEPTKVTDYELAISFQNDPESVSEKYYNEYVEITSTIKTVNENKNELVLEYTDPDGKYTLEVICPMASSKEIITSYRENTSVTVRGTVKRFAYKTTKKPNTIYLSDCFAG